MSERIDAFSYWIERIYGEKVPVCSRCRSTDLHEIHSRACWHCNGCGWDLSDRFGISWVPRDERVRRPEEMTA